MTENRDSKDFVIYNRKFDYLFQEVDISHETHEKIHKTRGQRLGLPYVTSDF